MNYTEILEQMNKATLFDLHRMQAAIDQELQNPKRIEVIKRNVKPGQVISYFDADLNCLVDAVVIKTMKTLCLVKNTKDGVRWKIALVSINLNDVDTDIKPSSQQSGIPKQALKVGDNVGFKNKEGLDLYGKVIRLNPKTATIEIAPKHQWRVHYSHLFPVLDGEQGTDNGNQTFLPRMG